MPPRAVASAALRLVVKSLRAHPLRAVSITLLLLLLLPLLLQGRGEAHSCAPPAFAQPESWPPAAFVPFDARSAAASASKEASFTVVVNTFQRPKLLARAVAHYAACPSVAGLRVVWSEPRSPPATTSFALPRGRPSGFVRFDAHPTTSINNRFIPLDNLSTAAVFSVDDDVLVPCLLLSRGFSAWRAAPHALVGFWPRAVARDAAACGGYTYVSAEPALFLRGEFSIILTKAAFLHASYFDAYTHDQPATMREYVSNRRECEDIAMAFLIANATRAPPVWVRPPLWFWAASKIDGIGRGGISNGGVKGHHTVRGQCVADFVAAYGRDPLVVAPLRDGSRNARPKLA